jgi:hypothetical protein
MSFVIAAATGLAWTFGATLEAPGVAHVEESVKKRCQERFRGAWLAADLSGISVYIGLSAPFLNLAIFTVDRRTGFRKSQVTEYSC